MSCSKMSRDKMSRDKEGGTEFNFLECERLGVELDLSVGKAEKLDVSLLTNKAVLEIDRYLKVMDVPRKDQQLVHILCHNFAIELRDEDDYTRLLRSVPTSCRRVHIKNRSLKHRDRKAFEGATFVLPRRRRHRDEKSSQRLEGKGGTAGDGPSSSVSEDDRVWESSGGTDQITVVQIDDSHIAELQAKWEENAAQEVADEGCNEIDYYMPVEGDGRDYVDAEITGESLKEMEEEEEEGVYVIEYSNPEEEGESYRFKLAIDKQLPTKEQMKPPPARQQVKCPSVKNQVQRPPGSKRVKLNPKGSPNEERMREMRESNGEKGKADFHCPICGATFQSNNRLFQHEVEHSRAMAKDANQQKMPLVCRLCPPPGKRFKKVGSMALHIHHKHYTGGMKPSGKIKDFFCTTCQKPCHNQRAYDGHIRRHANQLIVYQCGLCPLKCKSKVGFKKHLQTDHPGVIPRCDVCGKNFRNLTIYLHDQFRHYGVTPYYCPKCKTYDLTERNFKLHMKNHSLDEKMTPFDREAAAATQVCENGSPQVCLDSTSETDETDDSDS